MAYNPLTQTNHAPTDSLMWLHHGGGLDVLEQVLFDAEDDPARLDEAVAMLETIRASLEYELDAHGLHDRRAYSTGQPVLRRESRPYVEPEHDGQPARTVIGDFIVAPYPDGDDRHPVTRRAERNTP